MCPIKMEHGLPDLYQIFSERLPFGTPLFDGIRGIPHRHTLWGCQKEVLPYFLPIYIPRKELISIIVGKSNEMMSFKGL